MTQHGRRGRNCTLSCSEHCPSEWAAPTKQSFLEEAGLVPFRRPPFIYLDVEVRQAPGKSRFAPSSISAGILLSRGWGPGANYSCAVLPQPKGIW